MAYYSLETLNPFVGLATGPNAALNVFPPYSMRRTGRLTVPRVNSVRLGSLRPGFQEAINMYRPRAELLMGMQDPSMISNLATVIPGQVYRPAGMGYIEKHSLDKPIVDSVLSKLDLTKDQIDMAEDIASGMFYFRNN